MILTTIMQLVIRLFGWFLRAEAQRFRRALETPQVAQQKVQAKIFRSLVASDYGKALEVRSLADWQKIPIVDYADLEPWIERQKQTTTPLLTPEPVLFYERTSGSRGAAKWIPYTRSLRRSFSHLFAIWAQDLIQHGPAFTTGKVYFCISPQLTPPPTTAGVPVGLTDDSEYLDGWMQRVLRPFLVAPAGLNRVRDSEIFKRQLCLALLQTEKLEIISIWSPSFLTVLLDYIHQNHQLLCEQLRDRISPQRLQLIADPATQWIDIWPHLKLISCWDSVYAADQAQALRSRFPGVMVQGKGLLATEAPITVPLLSAQGCVPLLDEVFFEFIDLQPSFSEPTTLETTDSPLNLTRLENFDSGFPHNWGARGAKTGVTEKIHLLHELEIGQEYALIVSQKGGLYRYRIGDRVRVTHNYLNTPCLEFIGRDQSTSDLVGEKLHAAFVAQVLDNLELGGSTFRSLVPVTEPYPHYLLLLDRLNCPEDAIAVQLDTALCESPHYHQARLLGQLAPAEVLISPTIQEWVTQQQIQAGKKWGDIKYEILAMQPFVKPQL